MEITVRKLIQLLSLEDPDRTIDFGGLEFQKLSDSGPSVLVEFERDEQGNFVIENPSS